MDPGFDLADCAMTGMVSCEEYFPRLIDPLLHSSTIVLTVFNEPKITYAGKVIKKNTHNAKSTHHHHHHHHKNNMQNLLDIIIINIKTTTCKRRDHNIQTV
jgi:hypothetical protein